MDLVDTEFLAGLAILLFGAILGTSGAAALLTVWFPSSNRALRIFIATITIPLLIVGPILLFSFAEGASDAVLSEDLLMGSIVTLLFCLLGWPVAHFLTRALDRQRSNISDTFE